MSVTRCPQIIVAPRYGYGANVPADRNPDEVWTCGQREGHPGPHNRYSPDTIPEASCDHTAWADCDLHGGPGHDRKASA